MRDATPGPTPLPTLGKRMHVRVVLPQAVRVYARVRTSAGALGTARGVVADVSAGGMAVNLIEGGRFDLPPEGGDAQVLLDYEGEEANVTGRVVRVSAREVSFAFPSANVNEELNLELLQLMASVVTRRVELVDRRAPGGALASKLTHRRFYGAGYLDLRVQTQEPAWWQVVFLEYLVAWKRGADGGPGVLTTGFIDRSFSAERASDPLAVRPNVTRHAEPWPKLRRLATSIASKCMTALPGHGDAFRLVTSVCRGRG